MRRKNQRVRGYLSGWRNSYLVVIVNLFGGV
jgi:hypothetical protein